MYDFDSWYGSDSDKRYTEVAGYFVFSRETQLTISNLANAEDNFYISNIRLETYSSVEDNSYVSSPLGPSVLVNEGFFASSERDPDFLGGFVELRPGESVTLSFSEYESGTIFELSAGSLTYYFMVDDDAAARLRQAQS